MALEGWIHFLKPWIQSFRSMSNQRYDFCKLWMFCIFYSWFLSAFFRRNILKDLILIGFEGLNPFLKAWIQFYRGYDVSGAPRVQFFCNFPFWWQYEASAFSKRTRNFQLTPCLHLIFENSNHYLPRIIFSPNRSHYELMTQINSLGMKFLS